MNDIKNLVFDYIDINTSFLNFTTSEGYQSKLPKSDYGDLGGVKVLMLLMKILKI